MPARSEVRRTTSRRSSSEPSISRRISGVWDALLYARSEVVLASALAGVSALDSPCMDVPALEALADESRRTRKLGFVGKAAIHPTQVPVIQEAFSPTPTEVRWARRIVAAYEENEGGVLLVDQQVFVGDRPGVARVSIMIKDDLLVEVIKFHG